MKLQSHQEANFAAIAKTFMSSQAKEHREMFLLRQITRAWSLKLGPGFSVAAVNVTVGIW